MLVLIYKALNNRVPNTLRTTWLFTSLPRLWAFVSGSPVAWMHCLYPSGATCSVLWAVFYGTPSQDIMVDSTEGSWEFLQNQWGWHSTVTKAVSVPKPNWNVSRYSLSSRNTWCWVAPTWSSTYSRIADWLEIYYFDARIQFFKKQLQYCLFQAQQAHTFSQRSIYHFSHSLGHTTSGRLP